MSNRLNRLLAAETNRAETNHRAALAAGVLLLEMAAVDGDTTPVELGIVQDALQRMRLDGKSIAEVVELADGADAATLALHAATVRNDMSTGDRYRVVDAMRAIVWSDGVAAKAEHQFAAQVATALGLPLTEVNRILTSPA